jgi:hypothetical protein
MGIGRAVDAEDGLVDEVRSIGFARDVGAKMEEAGTLTKVTSGASAMEHRGLAMALLASGRTALVHRKMGHVGGKEYTNRVGRAKAEAQSEYLIEIEWVCVHDSNVHLPFLKVVRFRNFDARGELLFCLQFVRIGISAFLKCGRVETIEDI